MADIFVSYKREERAQVERLATALRGLGFSVWFDASLSAGENFSDEIDREVRAARIVLVCWSPAAAMSQWVKAEAQIGFSKGNLISTRVAGPDEFEPPVPFNASHTEDLRAWTSAPSLRDTAWRSVLRRAGELGGKPDVEAWGALGADAPRAEIEAWFARHGATSPLVLEAESLLREREAADAARAQAEAAARERFARLTAEREAAETEARAAAAEQRAARAERGARVSRRTLMWAGGGVGVAALGGAAVGGYFGLNGDQPFLRAYFPEARITEAGDRAGILRITADRRLSWPSGGAQALSFSPYRDFLLTAAGNDARLWNVATGAEVARMSHRSEVTRAVFSPDGVAIATSGLGSGPQIWSRDGVLRHALQGHALGGVATLLVFSPDARRIATACNWTSSEPDRTLRIWDVATGAAVSVISDHERIVRALAFSPDGARIVTGSEDSTLRMFDVNDGALRASMRAEGITDFVAFSPDGATIFSIAYGKMSVWDAGTFTLRETVDTDLSGRDTALSPDGRLLAGAGSSTGARRDGAEIWDLTRRRRIARFDGHTNYITSVAFSPDGARLVTGAFDHTARLWDAQTGAQLAVLSGHADGRVLAAFHPHGDMIATATDNREPFARIWSIQTDRA